MSATLLSTPPLSDPRAHDLVAQRLGPDDVPALTDLFERMSPEARRLRFFTPVPQVSPSMMRHLCDVDQDVHRAWMIRESRSGAVVAEVRGVRERDAIGSAEVALAVRDDWSGRGLGSALLGWIGADVAGAGVTTLTCEVLPDNTRSRRLFARAGFTFRFHQGTFVGSGPIPDRRPCIPSVGPGLAVPFPLRAVAA